MTNKLVIINTGCANISSVKYAFERLGVNVDVSDDHQVINTADKIVLPGVGSAWAAMNSINKKQLTDVIQNLTQPVLGICLGMQLMANRSWESPGSHINDEVEQIKCLGLIPTEIRRLKTEQLVSPHMGWNQVIPKENSLLFSGIPSGSYFYFVHSFCAPISDYTVASAEYGEQFSASIGHNNFIGVQFHPERSGDAGAQLLKNFIEM